MASYLGIDTSNYRTSVCIFSDSGSYENIGELLPVEHGALGIRQNDAVFIHTRNLSSIFGRLSKVDEPICGIGVSTRPRDVEGSYMPCFLAGKSAAAAISYTTGAPVFEMSHQTCHILAGIFSCGGALLDESKFLSLHLSGGTSEILHIENDKGSLNISKLGGTLDINAGQLIDRTGIMLGLMFPCGAELETLCTDMDDVDIPVKISVQGSFFNLSGHQNIANKMFAQGAYSGFVANYVIRAVTQTVLCALKNTAGSRELPILFVGGVCANKYFRRTMEREFSKAYFASAALSGDNALGCAYGAYLSSVFR